ncbi:MAG: rhomboid family intramembrane serine protease, partial [Acidobacteria bacterium ACB2]|nr:rhomboid family intramembrane serine protease [Acidobacteria bacterium ACB2]
MLLLPIGQENAEIRRHPWVFWGLLGLNVLAFVLVVLPFRQEEWASRVRDRAEAVGSYLVKHPYLRLPKGLMEQVPPEALSQIAEVRQAALSEEGVPIPYVVREQQAELNRLAEAFLAAVGETPQHRWGLVPSRLRVSAFLTHMFLHAGWLHILGNLLFLYLTAPFVEDLYGRPLFLALYVGSGLLAAATHVWQHPHSALPLVGASGAIAGVMGAFLVRLGRSRIEFFFLPVVILPWIRFRFFLPAFVFLPLWLLEQLWYARHEGLAPGTAWWAHVGGFVAGAGMALAIRSLRVEERWVNPGIEAEISFVQHPALGRA